MNGAGGGGGDSTPFASALFIVFKSRCSAATKEYFGRNILFPSSTRQTSYLYVSDDERFIALYARITRVLPAEIREGSVSLCSVGCAPQGCNLSLEICGNPAKVPIKIKTCH